MASTKLNDISDISEQDRKLLEDIMIEQALSSSLQNQTQSIEQIKPIEQNKEQNKDQDKNHCGNDKCSGDCNKKREYNELHESLWTMAGENIEPLIYSHCSATVKAVIGDQEVECILDTGAQTNVISFDLIKKLDLESYIDKNFKGKIVGVGSGDRIGIIPYLEIRFNEIHVASNFTILDSSQSHNNTFVLIGMPFMMFYKMKLDFEKSKMNIMGHDIDIIIKDH